jgi:uncharacterized repeat protein (TIGR02543 family)
MPTADTSQTTRTRLLIGKLLSNFHNVYPDSYEGGKNTFPQSSILLRTLGNISGDCCSQSSSSSTYIVIYAANGGNGTPPTDGSSPYSGGSTVTVLGNPLTPNTLTKTGYQFAGWNTAADGSGTNYVGGTTFTITQNTTLYAQWIVANSPRLVYNANPVRGGTGIAPSSSGTSYSLYSSVDIVNNTFTNTNGYTFGGWNTAADGSGTSYPVGSEISMSALGTVTLYAQWINPNAPLIPLTYNANSAYGGSGTNVVTTHGTNSAVTISGNPSFTNSGPNNTFYRWNTAADGTGTSYPPGSSITMNAAKTLYAQWVPNTSPYLVTYVANGATGEVPAGPTYYPAGVQVPILGQGSLTRPGFTFLGWNGSPTGIGSLYAPGFTFTSKTATLYAHWVRGSPVKYCGGGRSGGSAGSPAVAIDYYFPFAVIIQSVDTITVYTTALLSATQSNYGTGTAPLGITSIASKTVITSTNITINTNTSYLNPANDNNYSEIIPNGPSAVTYWPFGASISSITYSEVNNRNSSIPTYNTSTKLCVPSGCGLSANVTAAGGSVVTAYSFYNQCFTINFSNGASTFIANSPTNVFYTASTNPPNWVTAPTNRYPYGNVQNTSGIIQDSHDALTAITIIPAGGSTYVSPSMPATTVQYDGNGATGGTIPNPQYFGAYTGGTPLSITISGNTGTLTKSTVPNTFSRWNTAADGSGTNYGPGTVNTTYGGAASIILYAIWN